MLERVTIDKPASLRPFAEDFPRRYVLNRKFSGIEVKTEIVIFVTFKNKEKIRFHVRDSKSVPKVKNMFGGFELCITNVCDRQGLTITNCYSIISILLLGLLNVGQIWSEVLCGPCVRHPRIRCSCIRGEGHGNKLCWWMFALKFKVHSVVAVKDSVSHIIANLTSWPRG
jgi:hypothetical protein